MSYALGTSRSMHKKRLRTYYTFFWKISILRLFNRWKRKHFSNTFYDSYAKVIGKLTSKTRIMISSLKKADTKLNNQ
jgi:hypothetical protein